jgi:very-short-patch-repair endonuclease
MDILLLVILMVIAVAILAFAKGGVVAIAYPYQRSKYLLSNAERSFYGVLVQAVGDSAVVFTKVRVADVVAPQKGLGRSAWQRAFNAISAKHFDFVICAPDDLSVRLVVELDDASHGSSRAQKRDALLNGACQSAGLPLLHIKAAKSYSVAELRQQVTDAITPRPEVPAEMAAAATTGERLSH